MRDQDQANADAELESGHDHRQRAGQRDGPERIPAAGFVVAADVEIDAVDLKHAGRGVDNDRKEHADRHHEDFGAFAEAENQKRQRQDRALRYRIGRGHERIECGADPAIEPMAMPRTSAGTPPITVPSASRAQTDQRVGDQFARAQHFDHGGDDARRGGKKAYVDEMQPCRNLPDDQQRSGETMLRIRSRVRIETVKLCSGTAAMVSVVMPVSSLSSASGIFLFAGALHFFAQAGPDTGHQFAEFRRFLQFNDVARDERAAPAPSLSRGPAAPSSP